MKMTMFGPPLMSESCFNAELYPAHFQIRDLTSRFPLVAVLSKQRLIIKLGPLLIQVAYLLFARFCEFCILMLILIAPLRG